ncbi:MAG: DUF2442 domain-containing protein [Oscillospiraceae bacterium]|nr:DUF2442 domain-containing protein [Oscillospiraceae bacterium]
MNFPSVFMVEPHNDYTVNVYFEDGNIKTYDVKPLIKKGGMFARLEDIDFFIDRCVVLNNTLAWDVKGNFDPCECIDVCPDVIYNNLV